MDSVVADSYMQQVMSVLIVGKIRWCLMEATFMRDGLVCRKAS